MRQHPVVALAPRRAKPQPQSSPRGADDIIAFNTYAESLSFLSLGPLSPLLQWPLVPQQTGALAPYVTGPELLSSGGRAGKLLAA
jgi:hypothetical protein